MKIVIETGSESHTTSSARVQAKAVGGEHDGKFLYELKSFIVKTEWDDRWSVTQYELPEGFEFVVEGKGRTGPRGVNVHEFKRRYRVGNSETPVLEEQVNVGLRVTDLKGRLILVKDLLAASQKAVKITDDGF